MTNVTISAAALIFNKRRAGIMSFRYSRKRTEGRRHERSPEAGQHARAGNAAGSDARSRPTGSERRAVSRSDRPRDGRDRGQREAPGSEHLNAELDDDCGTRDDGRRQGRLRPKEGQGLCSIGVLTLIRGPAGVIFRAEGRQNR
jgi:hypothetical protein